MTNINETHYRKINANRRPAGFGYWEFEVEGERVVTNKPMNYTAAKKYAVNKGIEFFGFRVENIEVICVHYVITL